MGWLHQFRTDTSRPLVDPVLPRRVLRHLILSHGVGIGSRVLDAGCGSGELVRFFDQIGYDAAGLTDSPVDFARAREAAPALEFSYANPGENLTLEPQRFDLVVVRDLVCYRGNLFSADAFRTTASLLSSVCPGGQLVFLSHLDVDMHESVSGHDLACFCRHLSRFVGTCRTAEIPDGILQLDAWDRLRGRGPGSGYLTASCRLPAEVSSPNHWRDLATAAVIAFRKTTCCGWATEERLPTSTRLRRAA